MCKSEFTRWAIIEDLSIRPRLRTCLISWRQKTRYRRDMSSGLRYVSIWMSFWIFLPQSNNFRDGSDCLGQHWESFFIEKQWHEIILSPMCLYQCKMWKSNVKNIFISHVGLSELSQTTWFSGKFPQIAQSLTMSAHNRQSEQQNIIDRTHTWQQCSVTISEDILTTKYCFNLR